MPDISMIPEYNTKLFSQFWEGPEDFADNFYPEGTTSPITRNNAILLYYLLYANYGNNPVVNKSEYQFRFKVYGIIFQYGPTWEKRLSIQSSLRALTEDEMMTGARQIYNHSYNPSTEPSTDTLDELTTINEQNVNKSKKGILDAYALLWDLLKIDVTKEFIDKFKPLFKSFVDASISHIYISDEDEEEEDDDE